MEHRNMGDTKTTKAASVSQGGGSKLDKYRQLQYGKSSFLHMIKSELIIAFTGSSSGASTK
jgi:hypothetical protein